MADTDNKPTEEQVKAANEAETAKWQGDFDEGALAVPYKREDKEDEGKSDATGSNGDKEDEPDDSKDDADDEESNDAYADPAPVVTVQDPGEYQPADYSFEVTLKDGKTVTVKTAEEADKIADDPDNFETPKQLSDFLKKQMSMERKLERDKEKYDEAKAKFDEQSKEEQERIDTVNNMVAEFSYLVSKGLIPAVAKEYADADWSDPEVAKQSGVKEQLELLNYKIKEDAARKKAGVAPLTSMIDAYNAFKLENKDNEAEEQRKAAGEARKAAGARVAASSPAPQGSYVPKGIAVGNPNALKTGASVWDD